MNTLRISLEYNCYPVWIIDSDGDVIDNDLPTEIRCNRELDDLFVKIQELYDSCFIDTSKEFTAKGFNSDKDKASFLTLVKAAEEILRREAEGKYLVESHINL